MTPNINMVRQWGWGQAAGPDDLPKLKCPKQAEMRVTRHALFFWQHLSSASGLPALKCHCCQSAPTWPGSDCPPPPAHLCPASVSARLPTGTHLLHCPAVHIFILGAQSCSAYSLVGVHFPVVPTFLRDPHLFQSHLPARHPYPSSLQCQASRQMPSAHWTCPAHPVPHQCPPARWLPGVVVMRGARGCTRPSLISMVKKVFMASRREPAAPGAGRCSAPPPPLPRAF